MTGHLLLMSLGPIQDFIASARRCQDLWFGSWLLSELSRVTAQAVGADGVVVFPSSTDDGPDRPGVANKILARLAPGRDPRAVADRARAAHQGRLREIAEAAWAHIPGDVFHRDVAEEQLEELMELLWVAVPERDGGYATARAEAEGRLAAVKNTRPWRQPSWTARAGARVPKSALDGERESVIDERVWDEWSAERRRRVFGTKRKERLCGVGLLKRRGSDPDVGGTWFAKGRPAFHSTAHIATVPVLERIAATDEGRDAARRYLARLRDLGLDLDRFRVDTRTLPTLLGHDGGLLIESRLPDHFDDAGLGRGETDRAVRAAGEGLRALLQEVESGAPTPYYAFLLADGDRMGQAIDRLGSLDDHQALGKALDSFSQACRGIVAEHHGSLLYAGGDDVLALLPLHRALACARALATTFVDTIQPVVRDRWRPEPGDALPTLSAGLAIVHSREPMGEARELAKRAEKLAKEPRNALAIVLAKRSGGDLALCGGWSPPEGPPLDVRMAAWLEVLQAGSISSKTAHDLERLADHVDRLGPAQHDRTEEIRALAKELLQRKRVSGGGDADEARLSALVARATDARAIRELSAEMQVATALLAAHRNAGVPASTPEDR